jgi:hypothetical protein
VNVLDLVRAVCGETGIPQPTSLVGSADLLVIQLVELLNKEGNQLASRSSSGWHSLVQETTFTTVAAQDQGQLVGLRDPADPASGYILRTTDNYRQILNETLWNRSRKIPLFGPRSPRVWQGFKALTFAGPFGEYRIRGNHLLILPTPLAGETIAFEYSSRNWLQSFDGTTLRDRIGADRDIPLLDTEIMQIGLQWRWKRAKGLDYAEEFATYEGRVIDALSRDATKARLSLGGDALADSRIPVAIPRLIGTN